MLVEEGRTKSILELKNKYAKTKPDEKGKILNHIIILENTISLLNYNGQFALISGIM